MLRRAILGILFALGCVATTNAQDPEFTQFFNSPLYCNPALAGVGEGPRFAVNYRNQWAAAGKAYTTYAASYDQHIEALNGGIGFLCMSDRQANGLLTSTGVSGMYAYQINVSKSFGLKAAAQASLIQRRINASELVFAENIDPENGTILPGISTDMPDKNSKTLFDIGGGALIYTRKFYFGLSARHVTSPDESFISSQTSQLPMRWGVNTGFEFHNRKGNHTPVYFSPNLLFASQAAFKQVNAGAVLGIGLFYGGMFYRVASTNGDAFILLVGLKRGIFKMGYSYDATISSLNNSGGTHELAVVLNFHDSEKVKEKRNSKRFSSCPTIF